MGTKLVCCAALLLVGAIAVSTNAAVSSISTSSSTTPVSLLTSTGTATAAVNPKSKRGVVETGTNSWVDNGGSHLKSANPSTRSATGNQNSGYNSPQRISSSSSSSAYSPVQYNNPNLGYQPVSSYSSPNYANTDESYANAGQSGYEPTGPSYGNIGQSYVSSPQNYESADLGQSSGIPAFYTSQSQSTGSQSSPNFGSYHGLQPVTNSAQSQNGQSSQIQNSGVSTPYYTAFASGPSSSEIYTEKLPAGQYRANIVQVPQEQQSSTKMQPRYAANSQSASYVIPNTGSYSYQPTSSLNQGSLYSAQARPVFAAASQIHRNTLKPNPGQKSAAYGQQMYAPYHQSASSFVPNFQSNGFGPGTVDFNGKKIPIPVIQLQSAEDFPGFAQSVNTQPLILQANTPIPAQTEFGFLADFAKSFTPQAANVLPFLNAGQSSQPQILPVRSANGSPQFPQYKGASINTSPNYNQGRPAASYQPLNSQPQLHFAGKPALPPPPPSPAPLSTSSIIHHPQLKSRPVAEIRDDVEVIKKKKKPSPPPSDFDDEELDDGYKAIEREYGRQQDDEDDVPHRGKYFKESDTESDFKPSKGFPFKSYDEQFSKYSKPSSDDDSEEDGPTSRYRHSSSSEDDGDYDGHSSTHHANYRSPKARPSRYEDNGEESQTNERQEEAEEDEEHERKPSAYKSYGKDFEQEFEDSYRRELPKTKYVHIKEVPEIDEPAASSYKSYSSSDSPHKSSKSKGRTGYHQSHDEDPEESQSYGSHTSQKHRNDPKSRDSDEGYGSNYRSHNKGNSPKVVHEESYGYKMPDAKSYSKYKKTPTGDSYSTVKKSPKADSYSHASRSSYKSPKKDAAYDNGDSYSWSKGSSWKEDKKSPETSDYHGGASGVVKTFARPESKFSFHAPAISSGTFFISHSGKIERDLTGI